MTAPPSRTHGASVALRPIRTYQVKVDGFPPVNYSARSPSKARAKAWRDYLAAYDCSFKKFLQLARLTRIPHPPGVGCRVLVGGEPATTCVGYGQYIHYMRDDGDVVLCSHPFDVVMAPNAHSESPSHPAKEN